jgi:hypothetical protein
MKPSSAKAKGRDFQRITAAVVCAALDLPPEDCRPAVGGENGCDLKLSNAARKRFPFGVECKKQEKLEIWKALEQAETNAKAEGLKPLLVFSRNRSQSYAVVPLGVFMEMAQSFGDTDDEGVTSSVTS